MGDIYWLEFDKKKLEKDFEKIKSSLIEYSFINIKTIEDLMKLKIFIYEQLKDEYFKSSLHKTAFLLAKYENRAFDKEIGITRRHYVDKKLAKKWMVEMQKKFHPDMNVNIQSDINFTEVSEGINKAYGEMVGHI